MGSARNVPSGWLWSLGAAAVVTAARWREIGLHGGEIPYLDQWRVEAGQILLPWLAGKLSLVDFLLPHHEHVPAWTRLLAWLEAVLFGLWDGQFQATRDAALMGVLAGLISAGIRRAVPLLPAIGVTLLTVILLGLPHSWENMVWGFQSTVPLALLFVVTYVHGSFASEPGTAAWRWAHAAGIAMLFTLGSMWAAALAVLLVLGWTSDWQRRRLLAAAAVAVAGVALLGMARAMQPHTGAYELGAHDSRQFVAALLVQLGWPSAFPAAAALLNLPVFLLALRLRGRSTAAAIDRTVLALALWTAGQAVAFAYARGSYLGFVSRYSDLLAVGVLANAVALCRLWPATRLPARLGLAVLTLAWAGGVAQGLTIINTEGHTLYFHEHSSHWAQVRRDAVRQYLASRNPETLSSAEVRGILFPDPAEVARALDQPRLVELLPSSVAPANAKSRGAVAANIAHGLRRAWAFLAAGGGLMFLAGTILTPRGGPRALATIGPAAAPPGDFAAAGGLVAIAAGALVLLWPRPFEFRPEHRWSPLLTPPGMVPDFNFRIITETNYPKDNLTGGAALWPEDFRNVFFGTHIDGPAFKGIALSTPFSVAAPWYVVPYAGFPVSAGNGLRLRVEDDAGGVLTEIPCPGPNAGVGLSDVGFWEVDVRRYAGRTARLVIYDGRDDAEGWVAAAPPQPAADGTALAAVDRRAWAAEGTVAGLRSLQVIFAGAAVLAASAALVRFLRPRPAAG